MRANARRLFIMIVKKSLNNRLKSAIFGVFFAVLSVLSFTTISAFVNPTDVYADPAESTSNNTAIVNSNSTSNNSGSSDTSNNSSNSNSSDQQSTSQENQEKTEEEQEKEEKKNQEICEDQIGALGWFICPGVGVLSKAVDAIYSQIETLLAVEPISMDSGSTIFYIWQIMRDITNILFVVVLLIVIYSQLTGVGITNYGIKKVLPKLIIAAVLVNLSFILCALAVDASNILGASLRGLFDSIQTQVINNGSISADIASISWEDLSAAVIGGGLVAGFAISVGSLLFPIIGAVFCAIISVLVGLITLGLRQSLISVLVMISPVAFICYLLPNTDKWFNKWKDIFISMLIFYPMFSLLFGASRLAGWALITTSLQNDSAFGVVLGLLVQVLPLILSISLMKMSGTILGKASGALDKLADLPKNGIKATAQKYRELNRNRHVNTSTLPSAHLQRFLDRHNRKLELDTQNETIIRKGRAEVWAQRQISVGHQNYDPTHDDEYKNNGIDEKGNKTKHRLKTTRSTRAAKEALNYNMAADNAARDTAHILGQYTDYHKGTHRDVVLGKTGAKNFFEYSRTLNVEENDAFADQDWLMGQYDKIRKSGEDSYAYKRYIIGGAGALGKTGEDLVLGQVIAKSAQNEAKRKNYIGLTLHKYGYGSHNKSAFRSMMAGWNMDDNGFAIDKNTGKPLSKYTDPKTGKTINIKERVPLEFMQYHPEYLVQTAYDLKDENGEPYFNLEDQEGNFVSRIYKHDSAAIKEIYQNWDMKINDPINNAYSVFAGIKPGAFKDKYPELDGIGLSNFSSTLERALIDANFKEKSAHATQFFAKLVGQRNIGDMNQLNIARLDSLMKTATASSYNLQDAEEFKIQRLLFNPENWEWMLFNDKSIRERLGIDNKELSGTRYKLDANGNYIMGKDGSYEWEEIPAGSSDLTHQDLVNTIVRKFLVPNGGKLPFLMSKITPNILDKQKAGIPDLMDDVLDAMDTWNNEENLAKYPGLNNPTTRQQGETIKQARKAIRRNNIISKDFAPAEAENTPSNFEPGQSVNVNNKSGGGGAITGASPALRARKQSSEARANHGSDQLTREDIANDYSIRNSESSSPWASSEEYHTYVKDIQDLAAIYENAPESFVNEAINYLENARNSDERLEAVLSDFTLYANDHLYDGYTTTADFCEHLVGLIAVHTYEN